MRYTIQRIDLGSIMMLGFFLGWLIALMPALILAASGVIIAQKVNDWLTQVKPFTIEFLGQQIMRVDLINTLQLQPVQQSFQPWARTPCLWN